MKHLYLSLLITLGLHAQVAITHIGAALGPNGSTTPPLNCTNASLMVVEVPYYSALGGTPALTDPPENNTWIATAIIPPGTAGSRDDGTTAIRRFYSVTPKTSAAKTFTISGTNIFAGADVFCVSGLTGTPFAVIDEPFESAGSGNSFSFATAVGYPANSVIITAATFGSAFSAAPTVTGSPAFATPPDSVSFAGNVNVGVAGSYFIAGATGGLAQPTWNGFNGLPGAMDVVVFQGNGAMPPPPPPPPPPGPVISGVKSFQQSVLIAWTTDAFSTTSLAYGPTTAYGTNVVGDTFPVGTGFYHSVWIPGSSLTPGTTYHYQVSSTSPAGTTAAPDATFTY